MRKYILIVAITVVTSLSVVKAQTRCDLVAMDKVECESSLIRFRFDKSVIDSGYMNNAASLLKIDWILTDKIAEIDSVVITASASLEGVVEYNQVLALRRAKAMKGYIVWKYPNINQHTIFARSIGEDWEGLRRLVEADGNAPYKEQLLKTLSQDVNPATKEWRVKQIGKGRAWSYITNHYLMYLRAATTCVVYYKKQEVEKPIEQPILMPPIDTVEQVIEKMPVTEELIISPQFVTIKKPLFALKTNLLFDAVSALNIELEVPIGKRWSVAGEWIFPWWRGVKSNFTMQLLIGHGEVKYWLGNRTKRNVMIGWSLGLYGGGGKYDFQIFNDNGVQGDFLDVGVSIGYAHKISRNLRMEYSLGFGYLSSDYEAYHLVRNTKYGDIKVVDYPWDIHRLNWFGPTRAKISLVWMLNYKKREVAP